MKRLIFFLILTSLLIPSISLAQHLFKCTDSSGSIVFSQTPCGNTQTETWVEPMPKMGVKGNNRLSDSDETYAHDQSDMGSEDNLATKSENRAATKSLKTEIDRINKAVNESIRDIGGSKKSSSASVMKIIASMEINRLNQIASLPIYSEADKQLLISSIDRYADRAVRNIQGTGVSSFNAKAEIEMTRTSLRTAITNL